MECPSILLPFTEHLEILHIIREILHIGFLLSSKSDADKGGNHRNQDMHCLHINCFRKVKEFLVNLQPLQDYDLNMFDKIFNAILAFLTRALYGPEVTYKDESMKGRHRLPGPAIIVSNHTCHLDGGILNTVFRKQKIHTLAAKDRFEQKFFGFMLRHTYCIPIDRQNADTSWVHESVRILKEGKDCVAIYPEGRHGSHRQQLPFHQGVAMLAFFVDVPVVVVYQDGPHRLFHRSKVIVDAPMMLPKDGGLTPEALAANTELLQQRMKDLMKELTDGE